MAQFYANIQGNRGEAARMGIKKSGINGHLRSWTLGVKVSLSEQDGEEWATVVLTGGSKKDCQEQIIGMFKRGKEKDFFNACKSVNGNIEG